MNKTKRAILRWSFIGSFLLITPIVVLMTAGYRFNPGKIRLERTGVVIVDSEPRGATVSLNGRQVKPSTPTKAVRVFPGSYRLRLEKDGFRPWEKDITIESGQTTFVNDPTLFSASLPEFERAWPVNDVAFSPDGRFVAGVIEGSGFQEAHILDLKTGREWTPWRAPAEQRFFHLSWSDDGRRLLIKITGGQSKWIEFTVWDAASPDAVRNLPGEATIQAFWSGNTLYAAKWPDLYEVSLPSYDFKLVGPARSSMMVSSSAVYGLIYDTQCDQAYCLGPTIVSRSLRDEKFENITTLPAGAAYEPIVGGNHVAFVGNDRIFLLGPSGKVTELSGRNGRWFDDGKRFVHWGYLEIRVYDIESGADELLTRVSSGIADVAWFKNAEMIVFAGGKTLTALENSSAESRAETTLATMDEIRGFSFSSNFDRAWIVGKLGHSEGLFSLKLK